MKIETKKLLTALENLRPIIGRKQTLAILSCVRLSASGGYLKIEATDLDQYQFEQVECASDFSARCVNCAAFLMSIAGDSVDIELNTTSMTIVSILGETELETLSHEEFPAEMKCDSIQKHGVNCQDIATGIKRVVWAASGEVARYALQSAHICGTPKSLVIQSTDGRNMAVFTMASISSVFEMLAPAEISSTLCAALMRDGAVLSSGEKHIRVDFDGGMYSCKQIDGKFPSTAVILSSKQSAVGDAKVSELRDSFSRLCFYKDPQKQISANVEFSGEGMSIKMAGKNCVLDFLIAGKFKSHTCKIMVDAFLNCIKNTPGDVVKISRAAENRCIILRSGDLEIHTMEAMVK